MKFFLITTGIAILIGVILAIISTHVPKRKHQSMCSYVEQQVSDSNKDEDESLQEAVKYMRVTNSSVRYDKK